MTGIAQITKPAAVAPLASLLPGHPIVYFR
jgi:hypothetical protein